MQPFVWSEIQRYGLVVEESTGCANPKHCAFLCDGHLRRTTPGRLEALLEEALTRFCEAGKPFLSRPFDVNSFDDKRNPGVAALDAMSCFELLESLALPPEQRDALDAFLQGMSSCPTKEVSAMNILRNAALVNWDYSLMLETSSRFSLRDGTKELLQAMIRDCGDCSSSTIVPCKSRGSSPTSKKKKETASSCSSSSSSSSSSSLPFDLVRLGHEVVEICQHKVAAEEPTTSSANFNANSETYDQHTVRVRCSNGRLFRAQAVVVAVPWNVLAANTVRFKPPLPPDQAAAIAGGHPGCGTKLYIRVRGKLDDFYSMGSTAFVAGETEPVMIDYLQTVKFLPASNSTLLVAFGPDRSMLPPHAHLTGPAELALVQAAVDRLCPRRSGEESPLVLEAHSYDWVSDRFARGTWTALPPGSCANLAAMQRCHGRLTFAGSDFALGWFGNIDGAIGSGIAAGKRIEGILRGTRTTDEANLISNRVEGKGQGGRGLAGFEHNQQHSRVPRARL